MTQNSDLLAEVEREHRAESGNGRAHASTDRLLKPVGFRTENISERPEITRLVTSVFVSKTGDEPRQVVFCGVDPENGSSSVCAHTGHALASMSSKQICLVDGNIHSYRLSSLLGVGRTAAPASVHFSSMRERCLRINQNLWLAGAQLMGNGRGALLNFDELKQRLTDLANEFDYLLIDAPATRDSTDAELLGQIAGTAILVIEADKTRRNHAAEARDSFDAAGIKLLGTVLNNRSFPIPDAVYKWL